MASQTTLHVPIVDFTPLVEADLKPGTEAWNLIRSQVEKAIVENGCFQLIYPKLSESEREQAFVQAEKVLNLPLEVKMKNNVEGKCFDPYHPPDPNNPKYESLAVFDPSPGAIDDILLAGNDDSMLAKIKTWLFKSFEMKDLGEASFILGIKVERDIATRSISLSQEAYIDIVLKRFHMSDCEEGKMPFYPSCRLTSDQCPISTEDQLDPVLYPYASAVGSIMYAPMCTHPNLAYTVSMLGRFQSNPGPAYWNAVLWALRYMRSAKNLRLYYSLDSLDLVGFSDSDYQGCSDTRKSTSGYVFKFCGGAVSWKSKKQECIAQSTMEAEYIALNEASKEAVYLKKFLSEMDLIDSILSPILILCDNNAAISISRDPACHSKEKYIEGRYHYARDIIAKGEIKVKKVASVENLADPLTKALALNVFKRHVTHMGLK